MIGRLVAFAASTDLDRSAAFYVDVLGLEAGYTVLGWQVDDIESAVRDLRGRGINFLRYDGMGQDEHDTWLAPSGTRIAWFSDPDRNTLPLEQPPR